MDDFPHLVDAKCDKDSFHLGTETISMVYCYRF